jgi:hypothetical protein
MILYLYVLIVFSFYRESVQIILVGEPPLQGDSVTHLSCSRVVVRMICGVRQRAAPAS